MEVCCQNKYKMQFWVCHEIIFWFFLRLVWKHHHCLHRIVTGMQQHQQLNCRGEISQDIVELIRHVTSPAEAVMTCYDYWCHLTWAIMREVNAPTAAVYGVNQGSASRPKVHPPLWCSDSVQLYSSSVDEITRGWSTSVSHCLSNSTRTQHTTTRSVLVRRVQTITDN